MSSTSAVTAKTVLPTTTLSPLAALGGRSQRGERKRPPLRLLETHWVCLGDVSREEEKVLDVTETCGEIAATATAGVAMPPSVVDGGGSGSEEHECDETEVVTPHLDASSSSSAEGPVWLLAGRTDSSYAALSDVISGVPERRDDGQGLVEDCLAHMLAIGPGAAGGESAALGRLKRYSKFSNSTHINSNGDAVTYVHTVAAVAML